LGAKQVCQQAHGVTEDHEVRSHIVTDRQALSACQRFLDDHRTLVEPACGAALAAVYDLAESLANKKDVLVVVCGGMGVSHQQLQQWQQMLDHEPDDNH
jgi:L-serine/L-threonine ammonia-lyase